MSRVEQLKVVEDIVQLQEFDFKKLAKGHGAVKYETEALFAIQAMKKNWFLMKTAYENQDSLKLALHNVAAVGLTLNPVRRLAYLVPRDKKVQLEIGYLGYIQIAVECGAIKWAVAELVYEADLFKYMGPGEKLVHKFDPFSEKRGELRGAYCMVKTHDEEYLSTMMTIKEIYSIRDRSVAWKTYMRDNSKTCPWVTDEGEMIKKTVIRRAYKSWPMTDTRGLERFERAINVNQADHELSTGPVIEQDFSERIKSLEIVRGKLEFLGREEAKAVEHVSRIVKRSIESLEDLTNNELQKFSVMLDGFIEKMEKEQTKEPANENDGTDSQEFGGLSEEIQPEPEFNGGNAR